MERFKKAVKLYISVTVVLTTLLVVMASLDKPDAAPEVQFTLKE